MLNKNFRIRAHFVELFFSFRTEILAIFIKLNREIVNKKELFYIVSDDLI